ncbi:MAG: hypothetical protein BCS36_06795 [Desulfovibrio sp. MES5]|nr:MAG: hypothetical protein BCS36_06795 [Desulfovibrio sp. MES5]
MLGLGWKWLRPGRAVPALAALSLQVAGRALAQNLAARLKSGLTQERPADERLAQERTGRGAGGSDAGNAAGDQGGAAASGTSA